MRDVTENPYTQDELRVCEYLQTIAPQIGCGDDPVGFLIASHATISHERTALIEKMKTALVRIESAMKIIDAWKLARAKSGR